MTTRKIGKHYIEFANSIKIVTVVMQFAALPRLNSKIFNKVKEPIKACFENQFVHRRRADLCFPLSHAVIFLNCFRR